MMTSVGTREGRTRTAARACAIAAALLAAAARERYVKKAPRGARWGRTTMCGNEYEEGPSEQVDCGMGHVPEPSRRFLDFYVKKS